jgi:hypothetical protein
MYKRDWKVISSSVKGPSHIDDGTPCQDYHGWEFDAETNQLILVACDGAGSCENSHHGAKCTAERTIEFCQNYDGTADGPPIEHFADNLLNYILDGLNEISNERGISLESLSCTLLAVIWKPEFCFAVQVGDGSISIELSGSQLKNKETGIIATIFVDDSEYVNETTFVTSETKQIKAQSIPPKSIDSFVIATDGLDPLATSGRCASPSFYSPILKGIRLAKVEDERLKLEGEMEIFLNSKIARERSHDDKSLVIATFDRDAGIHD